MIVSRDGWVKRQKEVKDLQHDAAARRRCGAGGVCRQHALERCVLHELRRGVYVPDHRRAGVDRLRRADSAAVQAEGRRAGRRGDEPRSTGRRRASPPSKKNPDAPPPVHAVAVTTDGYALRFGLEPFVDRQHASGPPVCAPGRRSRGGGRGQVTGREILIAATADARGLLCRADEVNFLSGPGKRCHSHQAGVEGRPRPRVHRLDRRPRSADRRDQPRRGADDQHGEIRGDRPWRQGTRAAYSAVSSRGSCGRCPTRRRRSRVK